MAENEIQGEWTLPAGWVWTTIGKIAETTSGGTPSRKCPDYYIDGSIPWIKSGELRDGIISEVKESITKEALGNSSAKIFPKGTPVVALYGATVGRTGILGIDAATNQAVCAMFALENAFTQKFITYWIQHQRANLIELSSGGAQPNISQRIVRAFPFPLAPLPEQHRIVAEIETQFTRLDAGVTALKRAQANLRRYKASVLKAACEGRLAPTEAELARAENRAYEPAGQLLTRILAERRARWEAEHPGKRYKEPAPPDTEDLPELPDGWVWVSLGQLAENIQYGYTESAKNNPVGPKFLRITDIQNGRVNWDTVPYCKCPEEKRAKYRLEPDDIVFARTGATTGKSYLVTHCPDAVFASYLIRLQMNKSLNVKYLASFLDSPLYWSQIMTVRKGSAQPGVNATILATLHVPLPPLAEQHRIAAEVERRLSVVAALEASVEAGLTRARRLRQSILKRAFEGRLAPQDPDDEPAPVLLERVRR